MGNGIYLKIKGICTFFGEDGIFFFGLSLIFINFLIFSIILFLGKKTGKKWRLFYFLPFFAIILLVLSFFTASSFEEKEKTFYLLFSLFFGTVFSILFMSFPEKKKSENKNISLKPEEKKLVSFLDEKIKRQEAIKNVEITENNQNRSTLDYSHVKNVIRRMENMPISSSEKKQLKDLSVLLYRAENGDSELKRSEINDGLGGLLKIMSKYGA